MDYFEITRELAELTARRTIMPKYEVYLTRMVEETATIMIEADNIEEAIADAEDTAATEWAGLKTEPGDWCDAPEAYAARDAKGELCWERE